MTNIFKSNALFTHKFSYKIRYKLSLYIFNAVKPCNNCKWSEKRAIRAKKSRSQVYFYYSNAFYYSKVLFQKSKWDKASSGDWNFRFNPEPSVHRIVILLRIALWNIELNNWKDWIVWPKIFNILQFFV